MKRLLTILLTCVSYVAFGQYGQCLLDAEHYHCSKKMQAEWIQMKLEVMQLKQKAPPPPPSACWNIETILDNSPAYIVNESLSKFRYVKDSCMAFIEYKVILHLSQNLTQLVFDLPAGIVPHHDFREQADLIFDANFETAIVLVNTVTKSIIFRRQDGKFFNNPTSVEISGRFFMQWQ